MKAPRIDAKEGRVQRRSNDEQKTLIILDFKFYILNGITHFNWQKSFDKVLSIQHFKFNIQNTFR